jgi:hypothetical protein
MTQVAASRARAAEVVTPPTSAPSAGTGTPVLASPPTVSDQDVGDAITQLYKMSSNLADQQMQLGKTDSVAAQAQRDAAAAQRKEALDRAVAAARKAREAAESGGPLSFVTKNIGLTGLVGLVTCNFSLVAADVTAHRTGVAGRSTGVGDLGIALGGSPLLYFAEKGLNKVAPDAVNSNAVVATMLGGPVGYAVERAASKMVPGDFEKKLDDISAVKDDDVRVANKIALTGVLIAAAATTSVLTAGTGTPGMIALIGIGISTTTQVASETGALQKVVGEKAAAYVAIGGTVVGAALTLGGSIGSAVSSASTASSATGSSVQKAKDAAQLIQGAHSVVDGTETIVDGVNDLRAARYQHAADGQTVRAQAERNTIDRIEKVIDGIIDDLQEAQHSAQRASETLQDTLQTHNQTLLRAGTMKV